ncbi:MAG: PAS domain S-box protein [Bacillati bacterium ANGP1]|uniref:histidine kinase n=1 Tax=Candidatus Segetimicrobium genomatis TaxID=2569760 RepID=A0A537KEK5_9BACT|nr:MAG: PAS domain S-box protein [Terrabacteria group bacterium ANGP1]
MARAPERPASGSVPLRVLILEDERAHAELMLRELRRGGFAPDWQRVETEQDFLARLDPTLDVILADYRIALFDAPRALRLMQDRGLDIPFIVVSGTVGEDMAVSILKQGAADYLLKDRLARLGEAVRRALEQKRLLAAQLAERNRWKAIVESSSDAILEVDVNGVILAWNPGAERIYGYAGADVVGRPATFLAPPDRLDEIPQILGRLKRGEHVDHFETVRVRKDGTRIDVSLAISPIRDAAGRITGASSIARDISERKQIQEAVVRAQEADRANKAKSEFLARMSHELRTPLNAILGFAQVLEMEPLRPDQREGVDQILKGGHHLLELISEVLDIARIEAGQIAIALEPIPLNTSVQETLTLVTPLAAKAGIRLHAEAAGGPERRILADPQRVKQVLLNLISNAVKYNRPGGSVTVSYEDAPPGRLRIKVSDTGRGIPQDKMHRLFAPFDRLGAEQTETEGTGLGLALCKRLVEAMGGTLGAESVEGRGSTFWVELARAPSRGRDAPAE